MPKLSDLLTEKSKASIQVGGAAVEIVWYTLWRERFSEDELSQLLAVTGRDYLKRVLPRVLVSWGVTDDDGKMLAITPESFDTHEIPDTLLFAIEARALRSDLSGKVPSSSSTSGS